MTDFRDSYDLADLVLQQTDIVRIVEEARNIRSFHLRGHLGARPGQFLMLWTPESGARPFSIADDADGAFKLTIANVGNVSSHLFEKVAGDGLGYFGPFGKPFDLRGRHIALVGGGYGSAPLSFLAKRAAAQGVASEFVIGARTGAQLLYANDPMPEAVSRHYCTEDGAMGRKGQVTDVLRDLLAADIGIDMVYTAGPEMMMKAVIDICDEFGVDAQLSLERHMKCGFGLCGNCCVDPDGLRMCMEGPCIDKALAKRITEFGLYHRDGTGTKRPY